MSKRKRRPEMSAHIQELLEKSKRRAEAEPQRKRLIEEAKRYIDSQFWESPPLTFPVVGMFGRLICVYDQTPTIEATIETLKYLEEYKSIDTQSYSYRISTLINFVFWKKMQNALEELTWEVSEMIIHEDIFGEFSAYEALAGRQRIPPRFLSNSKHVADTLRKQRWTATIGKGMRGKDRGQRKQRPVKVPAHEINRFKLLTAIMRVRSMPEQKQDELLNNKAKLAREAGMSYHTLRRSEAQGGWTIEDLIVESSPKKLKRAYEK